MESQETAIEKEESKTSQRSWTKEQFQAIQDVKGVVKGVGILFEPYCVECRLFAKNIEMALVSAGVTIYGSHDYYDYTFSSSTGIEVWLPTGSDPESNPLILALSKAKLNPLWVFQHFAPRIRTDIPVIFVGERYPPILIAPYTPAGLAPYKILPIETQ